MIYCFILTKFSADDDIYQHTGLTLFEKTDLTAASYNTFQSGITFAGFSFIKFISAKIPAKSAFSDKHLPSHSKNPRVTSTLAFRLFA